MPFSVMTTGSPLDAARRIARFRPSGLSSHPIWVSVDVLRRGRAEAGQRGVEALARVVLDADEGAGRGP